jgi:hypothetical protein
MKKYNFLFLPIGTERIVKHFNISRNFLLKCDGDVRRIVQISAKNLKNENGQCFLTALTNYVLYKLVTLQRSALNVEEERLLALFGRVLGKKDLDKMTDDQVKVLAEDFCAHLFWDVTSDRNSRHYMQNKHNVPVGLLKLVGFISLNQEERDDEN